MLPFAALVIIPSITGTLKALTLTQTYSGAPTYTGTLANDSGGGLAVVGSTNGSWTINGHTLSGSGLTAGTPTVSVRESFGNTSRITNLTPNVDATLAASAYQPSGSPDRSAGSAAGGSGVITSVAWFGLDGAHATNPSGYSTGWIESGTHNVLFTARDADGQVAQAQTTVVVP